MDAGPDKSLQLTEEEWVSFPGGELEGERPRVPCQACRSRGNADGTRGRRLLCFQCYRASLDRDRAIKAAADLDTASVERFESAQRFEEINGPRLRMLRVERVKSQYASGRPEGLYDTRIGHFIAKRRRAQIAARH